MAFISREFKKISSDRIRRKTKAPIKIFAKGCQQWSWVMLLLGVVICGAIGVAGWELVGDIAGGARQTITDLGQ